MAGKPWNKSDKDIAAHMYENGATYRAIADQVGRSVSSVENMMYELVIDRKLVRKARTSVFQPRVESPPATVRPVAEYRGPTGVPLVEALAPAESQDEPEDQFLERMLSSADRTLAKAEGQRWATLRIATREPVALSLSSDWHISPTGTDLRGLLSYADFVGHTPNLYALAVGDMTDNPIKHRGGNVTQVMDELRMLDHIVGRFKGKLLGMTSGNHDDWSKTLAGVDNLRFLASRHRIHYAPDELLWRVEIVDPDDANHTTATYYVHTRHQWRRGSALNPAHACWTWWQEEGVNWPHIPDVLAIGHNHNAVVESRQFASRDMWALRMGTWQVDSSYARAIGFGRYRATAPTVVLPPTRDERRVQCFADPHDAVTYMNGMTQPTTEVARAAAP